MLQGICIDSTQTTMLTADMIYFLFPAGPSHFYVSEFPKKSSHRGCFITSRFKVIKDSQQQTTEIQEFEQLSLF